MVNQWMLFITRDSEMTSLSSPLAVVCHDAGATNFILGWVKEHPAFKVQAFLTGPAATLWHDAFPLMHMCCSLDEAMKGVQSLLSGTGWESDLEHVARIKANALGIYSVAVVDHWVNYSERFVRNGQVQLPNEIWVFDDYARAMAHKVFPKIKIRQKVNFYLNSQVAKVVKAPEDGSLLLLMEPVRNKWGRSCDGEFQALNYFLENIELIMPNKKVKILLRPHPSEPANKYNSWLKANEMIQLENSLSISNAISKADIVVGLQSFALTIALEAGRQVYSCLPPWAPPISLPHPGIMEIRKIRNL